LVNKPINVHRWAGIREELGERAERVHSGSRFDGNQRNGEYNTKSYTQLSGTNWDAIAKRMGIDPYCFS
jgi:hypothetical protein